MSREQIEQIVAEMRERGRSCDYAVIRQWADRIATALSHPQAASSTQAISGQFPAPITNPEAWPERYADGFNDALRLVIDCGFASSTTPASGGEVVVTRNEEGEIVMVSRQDSEGRILSVIASTCHAGAPPATPAPGVDDVMRALADKWEREVAEAGPINKKDLRPERFIADLEAALTAAQEGAQGGQP